MCGMELKLSKFKILPVDYLIFVGMMVNVFTIVFLTGLYFYFGY